MWNPTVNPILQSSPGAKPLTIPCHKNGKQLLNFSCFCFLFVCFCHLQARDSVFKFYFFSSPVVHLDVCFGGLGGLLFLNLGNIQCNFFKTVQYYSEVYTAGAARCHSRYHCCLTARMSWVWLHHLARAFLFLDIFNSSCCTKCF